MNDIIKIANLVLLAILISLVRRYNRLLFAFDIFYFLFLYLFSILIGLRGLINIY